MRGEVTAFQMGTVRFIANRTVSNCESILANNIMLASVSTLADELMSYLSILSIASINSSYDKGFLSTGANIAGSGLLVVRRGGLETPFTPETAISTCSSLHDALMQF